MSDKAINLNADALLKIQARHAKRSRKAEQDALKYGKIAQALVGISANAVPSVSTGDIHTLIPLEFDEASGRNHPHDVSMDDIRDFCGGVGLKQIVLDKGLREWIVPPGLDEEGVWTCWNARKARRGYDGV